MQNISSLVYHPPSPTHSPLSSVNVLLLRYQPLIFTPPHTNECVCERDLSLYLLSFTHTHTHFCINHTSTPIRHLKGHCLTRNKGFFFFLFCRPLACTHSRLLKPGYKLNKSVGLTQEQPRCFKQHLYSATLSKILSSPSSPLKCVFCYVCLLLLLQQLQHMTPPVCVEEHSWDTACCS